MIGTMVLRRVLPVLALAALAVVEARPARADAIDGDWCQPDGRHFSIHGPAIVTPSGTGTTGNYSRHFFTYVVPAGDPDPGITIFMRLLNETTVDLRRGADQEPGEIWHRCAPAVSRLDGRGDKPARL
jgi:hypothetical protein